MQKFQYYWLVDPLDGTKEFLKRNGEFTVNIALISRGTPVMGVVHVPCQGKTYWYAAAQFHGHCGTGQSIGCLSKHCTPVKV